MRRALLLTIPQQRPITLAQIWFTQTLTFVLSGGRTTSIVRAARDDMLGLVAGGELAETVVGTGFARDCGAAGARIVVQGSAHDVGHVPLLAVFPEVAAFGEEVLGRGGVECEGIDEGEACC